MIGTDLAQARTIGLTAVGRDAKSPNRRRARPHLSKFIKTNVCQNKVSMRLFEAHYE